MTQVIGIIGGSGLYDIEGLEDATWETVDTPWGAPSDALLRGRLDVEELSAQELVVTRTPIADPSLPAPEASGFAIPACCGRLLFAAVCFWPAAICCAA